MKTILKKYILPAALLLSVTGCKKSFDELTQNQNVPNSVPASLLFNGVLNSIAETPDGQKEIYAQYYLYNYDYYGNNRYDLGAGDNYYTILKNVQEMEKQAAATGGAAINPYEALGKFFKAYLFSKMSLEMGDIPMTEALQGLDKLNPAYDSQKAVMLQSLQWLDSANDDLGQLIANPGNFGSGEGATLKNDIYFANDLTKWQKAVNALQLRLLVALSKKTADTDLKVVSRFAAILASPSKYPLMSSNADNLQYVFREPNNYYPQNPNNFGQSGSRKNMSATYVGLLTSLKDPRVFVTAEPSRYLVDEQKQSPTDFASFVGADPGLDLSVMYNNAGLQRYSFLNRKHFYSTYTGEPAIQIGFPEMMFNIAEGLNRGWASGASAETYYQNGIKASMQSYGIPETGSFTAYFYRPGSTSVSVAGNYDTYSIAANFATYYNQATVKYTADGAGLTKILQQRYLALFRHSGLESYFTYRRTGVPTFTTGPGTGNGTRIATRFQYPSSERTANSANYQKALDSQFGGNDDINGIMWILK
ncbi:SusD/RagB family nutrient-binding outer membrane lipoprotein [Mucilaginibacter pallidiroseus]|uniref:SusD/RagB family nutrient-binding outer membrane lipoprotein n=1 Tax=Mucilaginibacter pallidiroseus TaxID=2599295 RepID=A0A563UE33_9SPHI|nr:SusD/RagB family nutrient-binding outer membrane lipoprotein [Mucilaginibacter pallidiroseus]TWR29604.1 SusD/RagB family nutrient-binding outer membrane lipoprotein [Mucilaginibacter pallidiroseus]